ncbi:hypothetical protein DV738_g3561, partial [Chaetothyriales sp. CBS 135597]
MPQRCIGVVGRAPGLARVFSHSLQSRKRGAPVFPSHPNRLVNTGARHGHDVTPLRKKLKDDDKAARHLRGQGHQSVRPVDIVDGWELTVGIEIHAQLNTSHKLFSTASTAASADPNTHLAPFDLALPGIQPIFQKATLIPALRAALALNCDIQPWSTFDRKHYFYHDQPSGYQITQFYHPFATNGHVILDERDGLSAGEEVRVGIKQIQMEQDTARTHEVDDATVYVDFNRSGHPLIEIISLPQIHTPKAAAAYVKKIQGILSSVDALMAGLELGGMRADVNVSVRPVKPTEYTLGATSSYAGLTGLGTRTEIKNLSAFNGIEAAVCAERDRQISLLKAGGTVIGETRGWSVTDPHTTRSLRGKEGEVDYRYMPDPDILPLYIGKDLVRHLYDTLPRSPEQSLDILTANYGLSTVDAGALLSVDHGQRLYYFLDAVNGLSQLEGPHRKLPREQSGKLVANWVLHEMGSLLSTADITWTPEVVPSERLAHIILLELRGEITHVSAKQVLKMVFDGDTRKIQDLVHEEGLIFVAMSNKEYEKLAAWVIEAYPDHVHDIREGGKHGKIKFLLGQMMRQAEKGKIQATRAEEVLRAQLMSPARQ